MIKSKRKLPGLSDLPFEDHCDLLAISRFNLQGSNVGAYLLETKQLGVSHYSFVFGFHFPGIHTLLESGMANRFLQRLDVGLRKMQPNQKLRVHFSSFAQDLAAQQELSALLKRHCSTESQFFYRSQPQAYSRSHGARQAAGKKKDCLVCNVCGRQLRQRCQRTARKGRRALSQCGG